MARAQARLRPRYLSTIGYSTPPLAIPPPLTTPSYNKPRRCDAVGHSTLSTPNPNGAPLWSRIVTAPSRVQELTGSLRYNGLWLGTPGRRSIEVAANFGLASPSPEWSSRKASRTSLEVVFTRHAARLLPSDYWTPPRFDRSQALALNIFQPRGKRSNMVEALTMTGRTV